jgi:hypothetical protein
MRFACESLQRAGQPLSVDARYLTGIHLGQQFRYVNPSFADQAFHLTLYTDTSGSR